MVVKIVFNLVLKKKAGTKTGTNQDRTRIQPDQDWKKNKPELEQDWTRTETGLE